MKYLKLQLAAVLLTIAGAAQATVLTLPAANPMSVGVYNDFNVYSLDLLQQCAAASDPRCLPSAGLPVDSSPGKIKDQIVILAGTNGNNLKNMPDPLPDNSAVDNPFVTPAGNGDSFSIVDAGGGFAGDQINRWDISVNLLRNYLGDNDLVFLFDNNQQGSDANQWINIWGQVRIVDASGNTINSLCFELSTGSGCDIPPPTPSDYVAVVGDFCVNKATGASYNLGIPKNAGDCGADYFVKNNLNTSTGEFAAFNQTLNDAVKNLANGAYFLSMDIRYTNQNGGNEQLWICSDCQVASTRDVPEPATLPLVLMGLMAAGAAARRPRARPH